jgi:hypothetical protein
MFVVRKKTITLTTYIMDSDNIKSSFLELTSFPPQVSQYWLSLQALVVANAADNTPQNPLTYAISASDH